MYQNERTYTQFGEIDGPGGAMISFRNLKELAAIHADLQKFKLVKRGVFITPEIQKELDGYELRTFQRLHNEWRKKGISQSLKQLMYAHKKKEVEKIARRILITGEEFTALIYNSYQIGFEHVEKHPKFYPEQVKTTVDEKNAFFSNGVGPLDELAQKFSKKIIDSFDLRRCVSAHMFSRNNEWHCFYLSYEDAFGMKTGKKHWAYGDHIHYVSHLWGIKKEDVWAELDKRQSKIRSFYLRYNH